MHLFPLVFQILYSYDVDGYNVLGEVNTNLVDLDDALSTCPQCLPYFFLFSVGILLISANIADLSTGLTDEERFGGAVRTATK